MGFRENLLQKIQIDKLAATVMRSMGRADSGQRIDLEAMRRLVEAGDYTYVRRRDLDLYFMAQNVGDPLILLLDNELKIYATDADDIALRKSPTVKEMVSIRNAIKILNDKDVVVSRKGESVQKIHNDLIAGLDLQYQADDIASMAQDGRDALENNYVDGLIEVIELFAELLGYEAAVKPLHTAHHKIWGHKKRLEGGGIQMGPLVILNLMQLRLLWTRNTFASRDKAALEQFQEIIKAEQEADATGAQVFSTLEKAVISKGT